MERTYIMIKPDGVQRNLVGEIIARFEKKGYKLAALKVSPLVRDTFVCMRRRCTLQVQSLRAPMLPEHFITSGICVRFIDPRRILGGRGQPSAD